MFTLGGKKCNELHFRYITNPLRRSGKDWRKTKPDDYEAELIKAVNYDTHNQTGETSFYALVISHNFPKDFKLFV